jgi:hypothetical protein
VAQKPIDEGLDVHCGTFATRNGMTLTQGTRWKGHVRSRALGLLSRRNSLAHAATNDGSVTIAERLRSINPPRRGTCDRPGVFQRREDEPCRKR